MSANPQREGSGAALPRQLRVCFRSDKDGMGIGKQSCLCCPVVIAHISQLPLRRASKKDEERDAI